MKNWMIVCAAIVLAIPVSAASPTKDQAVALVREGAGILKAKGLPAFCAEVNQCKGQFHTGAGSRDPELYLFAYDTSGTCLAQGQNVNMVGKSRWEAVDPVSKRKYVQDFVETATNNPKGAWLDYNFVNPKTSRIEKKSSFLLLVNDTIIGCGIYK